MLLLATTDEGLRERVLAHLADRGIATRTTSDWTTTIAQLAHPSVRLALIDAGMPDASGSLLESLAHALPHTPSVYAVEGQLDPLPELKSMRHLTRLLSEIAGPRLSKFERQWVALAGLGDEPQHLLQVLAQHPQPIVITGERGTGKQRVARLLHKLRHAQAPFVELRADEPFELDEHRVGTLYLVRAENHRDLDGRARMAEEMGWQVLAGSQVPLESPHFTPLPIIPLRNRPADLKPLARLVTDHWQSRLGIPTRRLTPRLMRSMEQHDWPGNHRELESFIVQALTTTRGPSLSPDTVPKRVLTLLQPPTEVQQDANAYEELVEDRLKSVVHQYEPDEELPTLYRLVMDATERALLRLVLTRTGGNQKAAAERLGLARNTLRARIDKLDPFDEGRST